MDLVLGAYPLAAGSTVRVVNKTSQAMLSLVLDHSKESIYTMVAEYCLALKNGATANGTPVVLAACDGGSAQQWEQTALFEIRHVPTGKCLQGVTVPGGAVTLASCADAAAQTWIWHDQN